MGVHEAASVKEHLVRHGSKHKMQVHTTERNKQQQKRKRRKKKRKKKKNYAFLKQKQRETREKKIINQNKS